MTDTEPFPVVGSIWGIIKYAQIIPRVEAKALEQLLQHTAGTVRVTTNNPRPEPNLLPPTKVYGRAFGFSGRSNKLLFPGLKHTLSRKNTVSGLTKKKIVKWRGNQQADEFAFSFTTEISDKSDPTQVRQKINSWIDN